jgi:hypothetical protein
MNICRLEDYEVPRGIRILERILMSKKASREKKLLALVGLINIANGRRNYRWFGC